MADANLNQIEASVIQPGWEVYSSDDERVGTVRSIESDHFELELEIFGGAALEVPFDEVEAADDGRVELVVPTDMVGLMGWRPRLSEGL